MNAVFNGMAAAGVRCGYAGDACSLHRVRSIHFP